MGNVKRIAATICAKYVSEPKSYRISDPDKGCEVVRAMLERDAVFNSSSPGGVLNIMVQFRSQSDEDTVEAILKAASGRFPPE